MLEYKQICKSFGRTNVLSDVSFCVNDGEAVCIIGEHDSGKSMLLRLAAGLLYPDSGEVIVCGMPAGKKTKKLISFLPDKDFIEDNIRVNDTIKRFARYHANFERSFAYEMLYDLNIDLDKRFEELSSDSRRLLQTTLVLSRNAKVFLLDSPFFQTDDETSEYLFSVIARKKQDGATFLLTNQNENKAILEISDRVLVLWNGFMNVSSSGHGQGDETDRTEVQQS